VIVCEGCRNPIHPNELDDPHWDREGNEHHEVCCTECQEVTAVKMRTEIYGQIGEQVLVTEYLDDDGQQIRKEAAGRMSELELWGPPLPLFESSELEVG
jgi:hypothetical protein